MIFYERQYIPNSKRNLPTIKQPYSYRWHFDKPNSSNMLKIFIPIDIESKSGPLEVISKWMNSITSGKNSTYFFFRLALSFRF